MFKAVNDHAKETDFKGTWSKEQFRRFFVPLRSQKPTIDDLVTMFELLDPQKEGKITAMTFAEYLVVIDKLRKKDFDLDKYFKGEKDEDTQKDQQLHDELVQKVDMLFNCFDVDGDRTIGPKEFYNIVMA